MIFRSKRKLSDKECIKIKEALKCDAKEGMILLPDDIEVVGNNDYQIWTKGEYIKYISCRRKVSKEIINRSWKRVSKGYNFVIAIYRQDIKDYYLFSVEYFNSLFAEKQEETVSNIKEEDVNAKEDM